MPITSPQLKAPLQNANADQFRQEAYQFLHQLYNVGMSEEPTLPVVVEAANASDIWLSILFALAQSPDAFGSLACSLSLKLELPAALLEGNDAVCTPQTSDELKAQALKILLQPRPGKLPPHVAHYASGEKLVSSSAFLESCIDNGVLHWHKLSRTSTTVGHTYLIWRNSEVPVNQASSDTFPLECFFQKPNDILVFSYAPSELATALRSSSTSKIWFGEISHKHIQYRLGTVDKTLGGLGIDPIFSAFLPESRIDSAQSSALDFDSVLGISGH